MTDYAMQQIVKAHEKLKAQKATQPKTSTAPAKKTELSQAEIDRYVQIIAKAAEGYTPPQVQHQPNASLLDQIIIARLEAMGLAPAIQQNEVQPALPSFKKGCS